MTFIHILQTAILIILLDRNLVLRDRYKIALEHDKPSQFNKGYFAIWIYCKQKQDDTYFRSGGRRLFHFTYGKHK